MTYDTDRRDLQRYLFVTQRPTCGFKSQPKKTAQFSGCGIYRYELGRTWDILKPWVLFICLNPSTADEWLDDATSRVIIGYAKRWGYGGMIIGNLFAYRSTDPRQLRKVSDPIGPENDDYLRRLSALADETVCAWGDDGGFMDRDKEILKILKDPKCLTVLKSGRPGHPLYKSRDLVPIPFVYEE